MQIAELRKAANWEYYPNYTTKDIGMEQDSVSSLPGNNSSQMNLSNIVAMVGNVSSLASFSGSAKKREHSDAMDTNEIDIASTTKKHKVEQEQQIVHVKKSSMRGKLKKSNVKGKQKRKGPKTTSLELQEYVFGGQNPRKYTYK